jgi:hypothetical protein
MQQNDIPIPDATRDRWKKTFLDIEAAHHARGVQLIWRLVDGFLLYWNKVGFRLHPIIFIPNTHFVGGRGRTRRPYLSAGTRDSPPSASP